MSLNLLAPRAILAITLAILCAPPFQAQTTQQQPAPPTHPIVLHAARLLDVESGRITTPGEILIEGDAIKEVGAKVSHPNNAEIIDLGDATLLPGLIDAHVHLFLHPGAEDLQTVTESVPQRTITATIAAREDLLAGFTAERDMGTEGAGSADTAVRNAINRGQIPGPRLRISGNAINILGGEPGKEIVARGDGGRDGALRNRFCDCLQIFGTGVEEEMDVRVNQAGEKSGVAEINNFGVVRA